MTPIPSTSQQVASAIGSLCFGGDWACAHGDFAGLRDVAQRLADYVPEPVHCDLAALSAACASDPEQAAELWDRLKDRLYRTARR